MLLLGYVSEIWGCTDSTTMQATLRKSKKRLPTFAAKDSVMKNEKRDGDSLNLKDNFRL